MNTVTKLKFEEILSSSNPTRTPRLSKGRETRNELNKIPFDTNPLYVISWSWKTIGEKIRRRKQQGGKEGGRKEESGYYGNQATFWSVWHAKRSLEAKMSNNIYGAPCGKSKLAKRRRYLRPISSWSAMSSSSSSLIVCFLLEGGGGGGYKSEKTRARVCSYYNVPFRRSLE